MILAYLAAITAIILNSLAQVLLKIGANKHNFNKKSLYLNPWSLTGYSIIILVTIFILYSLQKMELKEMVFILSLSYLFVPLFSFYILKEKITNTRVKGIFIIFIGIVVFNLDKIF